MKLKTTPQLLIAQRRQQYQKGGFLKKLGAGLQNGLSWKDPELGGKLSSGASFGSSLVGMVDPADEYGVQSDVGAFAGGALEGASAGMALGPIGAGVGALVGGISSLFGNSAAEERRKKEEFRKSELRKSKAVAESAEVLANYNNMGTGLKSLKKGGTLWSYPGGYAIQPFKFTPNKNTFSSDAGLSFQQGGSIPAVNGNLKPIGESDSFEVKGHDPNATDDVLIQGGEAAVDHDEVIKPAPEGLRIFSDTLKPPGSKDSFSKIAKKLEKQKTKDENKFPGQNERVEEKLESLFALQQAMNGNSNGETQEEALQPIGETPGAGFEGNNMFVHGGKLYHSITPSSFGSYAPIGLGSAVMAKENVNLGSAGVYRDLVGNNRNGLQYKHTSNPRLMAFHAGGTVAEKIFEVPGFKKELATEPGHGPGAATFQNGGMIFKKFKKAKTPTGGTVFDYTSMSPEKNYQTGGSLNLSKFEQKWDPVLDSAVQAQAKQYGIEQGRGVLTADQIPGNIMSVMGDVRDPVTNQILKKLKALEYVDYGKPPEPGQTYRHLATDLSKFPAGRASGALAESLAEEDPFRDFPGRRIAKTYWEDVAPALTGDALKQQEKLAGRKKALADVNKIDTIHPVYDKMKSTVPVRHRQLGGPLPYRQGPDDTMQDIDLGAGVEPANTDTAIKTRKINWGDALATGATLAPVFANMQAARRLPNVPEIFLNKTVNLKKLDYADQKNMLQQGLRAATLAARQNSVNPNAQQAGIGNAQAIYGNQVNQMMGDINRQNTDIGNKQAMINSQILGANNQLLGQRSQAETARAANILGLESQARADLANKSLGLLAQVNQKKLDKQKYAMYMAWLNKQGAGLGDRNPFLEAEGITPTKNKMGGVVRRGLKLKGKPC